MVKNLKLLIVAIGLFASVKGQDSTKAAPPKVDSGSSLSRNYFFRFTGPVLSLQLCECTQFI